MQTNQLGRRVTKLAKYGGNLSHFIEIASFFLQISNSIRTKNVAAKQIETNIICDVRRIDFVFAICQ